MVKKWILIAVLAACILPLGGVRAQAVRGDEAFFRANQDFREGRYAEAARGYQGLVASGQANGHVYYNLGNAWLKMDRPGAAILNYERARLLIPRDADLAFNLSYALDRASDAPAPQGQALSSAVFWLRSFNLPELFWVFAALHVLLTASTAFWLFRRSDAAYYVLMACIFAWFAGALFFGLKYCQAASDDRAVVISKTAEALAGPEAGDTVLFRLREGTTVARERAEGQWVLVSLPGGKRGWMKGADVEGVVDGNLESRLLPF
jgi:tetratricopeptide (TPR) repeat protein